MNQLQLIQVPIQPKEKGETCRNCIFLVRNYYNENLKYCAKLKSNRTGNGMRKIKSGDPACTMFEHKNGK